MPKKILYIIIISAIVLIAASGLIWYFIFKQEKTAAPTENVDFTVPGRQPDKSAIKLISEELVISLRQNNGIISFYDLSGRLWQFNKAESKPVLIDQAPKSLGEIAWPKIFSPDGKKIVYYNSQNNGLFTGDPNGKNQRTLAKDLNLKDIILYWPTANSIALISKPSGLIGGNLWFFDIRNLNVNKIIDNFFGLETLFSPDGNIFIYSFADRDGKNLKLAIYDKKGNSKTISNVSTLTDKCAWFNNIDIYCAAPKIWPGAAILPDDYYKNTFLTNDDIWKINAETGEKTLIFQNIGSVSNMVADKDGNGLFFISKENQLLYRLDLR